MVLLEVIGKCAADAHRRRFLGTDEICESCIKDEGRPLGIGFQEQIPNHFKRLHLSGVVVSVGVKAPSNNSGR
jgi:hypothetical protein